MNDKEKARTSSLRRCAKNLKDAINSGKNISEGKKAQLNELLRDLFNAINKKG